MDRTCLICGKKVNAGMTDEDWSFFVHSDCFPTYMDRQFGEHRWMGLGGNAHDEFDGFYIVAADDREEGYCGTGIYYTEWDDDE